MNFSYVGGTTQQRAWVADAITHCTYPLSHVGANVTVQWVHTMPPGIDTRHPYMATTIDSTGPGGNYHIYIEDWADDPTNPNNRGLPDPTNDIQSFYEQSFVHELGHVVSYETFDPGDLIETATGLPASASVASVCSCFFKTVNGARQYGAPSEWNQKALAWPDEIRESVAEVFKVAFYSGRLIFQNRTNWKVDPSRWGRVTSSITAPDTGGTGGSPTPTKHATASLKVVGMDLWGGGRYGLPVPWGLGAWLPDPPYDESTVKLQLHSSSGEAEVSLHSLDDGRYRITITLSGSIVHFDDATRPVWLWLESDFAAGKQTGRVTSDAAGTTVLFEHAFHCGPQPAAIFTSEIYISQAVTVRDQLKVTDWLFSAPGQSSPNSVSDHFTSDDSSDYIVGSDSTLSESFWSWDGALHPFEGTGPYNRKYVPPDLAAETTVELTCTSTTRLGIGTSDAPYHWQANFAAPADIAADAVDDASAYIGPITEEWLLYAMRIGPITPNAAALADVHAYNGFDPPDYGLDPLGVVFGVAFDGDNLAMGERWGGDGPSVSDVLPTTNAWYYESGGVWLPAVDPNGTWFGRVVHWTPSGTDTFTGIWFGEPPTPDTLPDLIYWTTSVGPSSSPPSAYGAVLPFTATINFTGCGLTSDLSPPVTFFTWFLGPAKCLEWYRGQQTLDLATKSPLHGPSPVPVSPPAPPFSLVTAGPQRSGAAQHTRPTSGVPGTATRLVLA